MPLFGKKEKDQPHDTTEQAIGRVALPAQPGGEAGFGNAGPSLEPLPQQPATPERATPLEQLPPNPEQLPPEPHSAEAAPLPGARPITAAATPPPIMAPVAKSPARLEIEELLADGLTEVYQGMTPQEQAVFRQKGDEAATTIETMLTGFKATAKKVVQIIRAWLATIPRVNKYFLEQESKLKTDDVMKLQRKLKKGRRSHIDV